MASLILRESSGLAGSSVPVGNNVAREDCWDVDWLTTLRHHEGDWRNPSLNTHYPGSRRATDRGPSDEQRSDLLTL